MKVTDFYEAAGLDGVYIARSGKLSCTALALRNGGLCLYSPVAGLEKSQHKLLTELGGVSALLAPNHYHNKGLKDHANAFPDASVLCSDMAKPRLQKITGLAFEPLDILRAELPDGQTILEPAGLKTGEVWVQIESGSDIAWVVTDAFSARLLATGVYGNSATMLGTFPRYGVKDAGAFKNWVKEQVSSAKPTILLPCHGSPVKASDLGAQLVGLLDEVL